LKKSWDKIFLLWDNDEPGKIASEKWSKKWDIPAIFLDSAKDFSDLVRLKGLKKAKQELLWKI
jgi:hypothetical protein